MYNVKYKTYKIKNYNIMKQSVAVFCSANEKINPEYFLRTQELGEYMGKNGYELVFGGCNMGLMECIAKAVKQAGGHSVGVIPSKIEEHGAISEYVDEKVFVSNLSKRKDVMLERSDVIIALPGGIGTLDEIFTVAAAATIGYHKKKIILYNIGGYWDKLVQMIEQMQADGFIRGNYRQYFLVANNVEDMKRLLIDCFQPTLF